MKKGILIFSLLLNISLIMAQEKVVIINTAKDDSIKMILPNKSIAFIGSIPVSGKATFYSKKFDGRRTASGEKYSNTAYTAAHKTLPFKTLIRVTNTLNNKQVEVRVNDRCRRKNNEVIDLSFIAAKDLDMLHHGVVPITYQVILPEDSLSLLDSLSGKEKHEK